MKKRRYIWLMAGAMLMAGCHVSRKAAEPAPAAPVPAEEPMTTIATSASSILYSSKKPYLRPVIS